MSGWDRTRSYGKPCVIAWVVQFDVVSGTRGVVDSEERQLPRAVMRGSHFLREREYKRAPSAGSGFSYHGNIVVVRRGVCQHARIGGGQPVVQRAVVVTRAWLED